MSKLNFELIGEACALVRENPSVFAASGAHLDREYSEAAFRTRDQVVSSMRLQRARPSLAVAGRLPRGSADRQDRCEGVAAVRGTTPRSVMARMAAAMRMLGQQPDDALDTEWAKAVLLLTFLVWDDSSDAPEWQFCEFGRLPYRLVDGAGSFQHRSGLKLIIGPGWSDIVRKALWLVQPSLQLGAQDADIRVPVSSSAHPPSGSSGTPIFLAPVDRAALHGPDPELSPKGHWSVEFGRDRKSGRLRSAAIRWRRPQARDVAVVRVRGRSRVALLAMVFSHPDQDLTWRELQADGLAREYWAISDPDSLRRVGTAVRTALGPELSGYWNQSAHGIRWNSPPGFQFLRDLPDAEARDG